MVEIGKEYVFEGPDGRSSLLDLFEGRDQLVVYHLMWLWDEDQGCPSCSFVIDNIGHLAPARGRHGAGGAFLRLGERIFHTYSSYARGVDVLIGTHNWLDLTARGRQEDRDWLRHHDRYDAEPVPD